MCEEFQGDLYIWGTGNVCNHMLQSHPEVIPDFFIDNDLKKANSEIYGKKILSPFQIEKWDKLYVIVAVDNYMSIKAQLEKKGLKEKKQFVWYRDFLFKRTLSEIEEEAEDFLNFLKEKAMSYCGKSVIFSDFLAFDKGVCDYVNAWQAKGLDAVLLSEAYWIEEKFAEDKLNIPVCRLPAALSHKQYLKNEILVSDSVINCVENSRALKEASVNLRVSHPQMAEGYEYIVCYWADKVVRDVIQYWKPKEIIVWNAFYAFHTIIRSICSEKDVLIRYMEFGNIPGTIQVEEMGQMGESYPARFSREFMEISVSAEEYQEAVILVENLCKSKLNRNVQPQNKLLDKVKQRLIKERPIIVYAGQNDNEAGMQPYTDNTRKYHSPVFENSNEAAVYLAKICEKNNWNYIYKPHPMMMEGFQKELIPQNVIVVNNVDINDLIDMADVVVTILSTVSYIALIRNKPVLMLGYTQLREKGCTYEAFEAGKIELQLHQALCKGLTVEMKERFIRHIVQMKKYYAIEEDTLKNIIMG